MSSQSRVSIPGSERAPLAGARRMDAPLPNERITVTVQLRSRSDGGSAAANALSAGLPGERTYLSREEYEAQQGADPADITKIEEFAHEHQLDVVEISAARRAMRLSGLISDMQTAFGVTLRRYEHPEGAYRGREGAIHIPNELAGIITGVFGLDDRPVAKPRSRFRAASIGDPAFTPPQLASLYNFPAGATGKGQTIGILEFGGGYRAKDLKNYFKSLGLKKPHIVAVSVDGGHSHPTNIHSADGEVLLDIEVAGAVAPDANIVVYFAPNTTAGFLDALTAAVHDNVHKPSVISLSWGSPEDFNTGQSLTAYNQAMQDAATLGVTVCVAAGDNGSFDLASEDPDFDGRARVDFPASSPFALACGGTKLAASGGAITSEVVWDELSIGEGATGGGISDKFSVPSYQAGLTLKSANPGAGTGRGLPDVSGVADPNTGYHVLVDGVATVIGGTSAVAPLWAGLIACLNEKLGAPVGFLNPLLYSKLGPGGALKDIASGQNGQYNAQKGWDACTGWGSPNGTSILNTLQGGIGGHAIVAGHEGAVPTEERELLTPTS